MFVIGLLSGIAGLFVEEGSGSDRRSSSTVGRNFGRGTSLELADGDSIGGATRAGESIELSEAKERKAHGRHE